MKNIFFPTTIIDGFFEDPDSVREFGLKQKFVDDHDNYPGARTQKIVELNPLLFKNASSKFIELFFPQQQVSVNLSMTFQIVDSRYGSGWIHRDPGIATAIIYLNKEHTMSGTSLYKKKNVFDDIITTPEYNNVKHAAIKQKTDNIETRIKVNSCYEEVLNVKGLYNRALLFDSHQYHAAHNFFGENINDSRLTIVVFFHEVLCNMYPIQRMHTNTISII